MTSKSPYEIRLDVLQMAQQMLERDLEVKMRNYQTKLETLKEINVGELAHTLQDEPKMYSETDLVNKASSLYSFISDSSRVVKK